MHSADDDEPSRSTYSPVTHLLIITAMTVLLAASIASFVATGDVTFAAAAFLSAAVLPVVAALALYARERYHDVHRSGE